MTAYPLLVELGQADPEQVGRLECDEYGEGDGPLEASPRPAPGDGTPATGEHTEDGTEERIPIPRQLGYRVRHQGSKTCGILPISREYRCSQNRFHVETNMETTWNEHGNDL